MFLYLNNGEIVQFMPVSIHLYPISRQFPHIPPYLMENGAISNPMPQTPVNQ